MTWDRWLFDWPAKRRTLIGMAGVTLSFVLAFGEAVGRVVDAALSDDPVEGTKPPVYDSGDFWIALASLAAICAILRVFYHSSKVNWVFSNVHRNVITTAWIQAWACVIIFCYAEGPQRGASAYVLAIYPMVGALIGSPIPLSLFFTATSIIVTFLIDLHLQVPEVRFARYSHPLGPFGATFALIIASAAVYLFASVFTRRVHEADKMRERQSELFCAFLSAVADLNIDLADELLDQYLDIKNKMDKARTMNRRPSDTQSEAERAAAGGETKGMPDDDERLVASAEDCLAALARLRPYLPLALRAAQAEEGDFGEESDEAHSDDDAEDEGSDPFQMRGAGATGGVVSSFDVDDGTSNAGPASNTVLRERACTVMHVECLDIFDAASSAEASVRASEFVSIVVEQVLRNDGTVDHMTPWSVTASFNGQTPCPRHAKRACSAALGIASRFHGNKRLDVFVAVDTRANLCGVCGVDRFRARVVSGDGVELTRKLPRLGRYLNASVVITENVHREVSSHFDTCPIDVVRASMITQQPQDIALFELRVKRVGQEHQAYVDAFNMLREGKRTEALQMLGLYHRLSPKRDHQSTRLLCVASAMPDDEESASALFVREEQLWAKLRGEEDLEKYTVDETDMGSIMGGGRNDDAQGAKARMEEAKFETVLRELQPETAKPVEYVDDQEEEGGLISMFCFGGGSDDGGDNGLNDTNRGDAANPDGDDARTPPRRPLPPDDMDNAANGKNWVDHLPPQFSDDVLMEQWKLSKLPLGTGTFSSVYLGMSLEGLLVAMKCVDLKAKQTDKGSLSGEVVRMRKLQHHNVVSYISCANIGKSHFIIIMEYVSGGSLKHVLETFGPPPLPAVRKYVTDLLRGLKYLHDNGMIHCDIKPHNALLTPDGSVKLSDFGSSVNVTLYGGQNADGDEQVLVRGTSYYLAPEACRNEITSAVDIWSVGVTVLELLTGRLPWEIKGSEANFIRELGKNEDMRPMIPADIPSNAAAFCKMCLHRDPAMRPTADALLRTPFLSG